MRTSRTLYGTEGFRAVAGETLRPGGIELTRHGLELLEGHGLRPAAPVLDLGCGPGATVRLFASAGYRAVGLDWNPGAGADGTPGAPSAGDPALTPPAAAPGDVPAPGQQGGLFVCGDICALPFARASFACCIAECVLALVDTDRALAECRRVLEDDGLLFMTDLLLREGTAARDGEQEPEIPRGSSCLAGAMAPWQWEEALVRQGFRVLHREDHSRALARLTAELVWYDALDGLDWLLPGGQCRCSGGRRRYGYGLFVARKCA